MNIGLIATQLLQIYFEILRISGRTPEETEAFYQTEKTKFSGQYHPDNLPKP